jgi:biopolymer transport protein ExbD
VLVVTDGNGTMRGEPIHRKDDKGRDESAAGRARGRRRTTAGARLTLNLVPMIDIVFLLLIFFLVGTRFITAEGVLPGRLPRQDGRQTLPVPVPPIQIRLAATSNDAPEITIAGRTSRPRDFEQLAAVLAQIQREPGYDDQTPVVLQADEELAWDHVVNAYNAAVRARYRNIIFGAE